MAEKRKSFTFREIVALLLVAVGISWFLWKNPRFNKMKSDLNTLAKAESEYYKRHGVYMPSGIALNISPLEKPYSHEDFTPSFRVVVKIYRTPDGKGWWAEALQDDVRGSCVVFFGTPKAVEPASEDNVPACTRARRKPLDEEE